MAPGGRTRADRRRPGARAGPRATPVSVCRSDPDRRLAVPRGHGPRGAAAGRVEGHRGAGPRTRGRRSWWWATRFDVGRARARRLDRRTTFADAPAGVPGCAGRAAGRTFLHGRSRAGPPGGRLQGPRSSPGGRSHGRRRDPPGLARRPAADDVPRRAQAPTGVLPVYRCSMGPGHPRRAARHDRRPRPRTTLAANRAACPRCSFSFFLLVAGGVVVAARRYTRCQGGADGAGRTCTFDGGRGRDRRRRGRRASPRPA